MDYTSNPLQAISIFAMMNRQAIIDELAHVHGDARVPNWILDLTTTSLFSVLCYWGERYDELEVYCDRSKPLETETAFLRAMVGRQDQVRVRMFGKERQYTFNLVRLPSMVDSRAYPGVQIADVLASALARAWQQRYRNQFDATEREWLMLARESFLGDNIWPDLNNADPRRRHAFVNSSLLLELTNRCLKRQDFFDGIPEFIAAAHETYPMYLADIKKRVIP